MADDSTQSVDYDSLAAKHGGTTASTDATVDYDALAAKHGSVGSDMSTEPKPSFSKRVYDRISQNFIVPLQAFEKTGNAIFDSDSPERKEVAESLKNLKPDPKGVISNTLPNPIKEYHDPANIVGDIATAAVLHQASPEAEAGAEKPVVTGEPVASKVPSGMLGRALEVAKSKLKVWGVGAKDLEYVVKGDAEIPTKPPTPKPPTEFEGAGAHGTPVDQWGQRIQDPIKGMNESIAADVKRQAASQTASEAEGKSKLDKAQKDIAGDVKATAKNKADATDKFSSAEKKIASDVKSASRPLSQIEPQSVMQAVNELGSHATIEEITAKANELMDARAASDAAFNKNHPPEGFSGNMSPLEKDLWQESVFGQKPAGDIGSKVRASNPEPTRAEVKAAASLNKRVTVKLANGKVVKADPSMGWLKDGLKNGTITRVQEAQ